MREVNRVGRKYGMLTVIEKVKELPFPDLGLWQCLCDCGVVTEKTGKRLYGAKSCGCAVKKAAWIRGNASRRPKSVPINHAYRSHKQDARKRGLIPLPRDQWNIMVVRECDYCGKIDTRRFSGKTKPREGVSCEQYEAKINGVDRIDSAQGYSLDNCVPCCHSCNILKLDMSRDEFLAHVKKILSHLSLCLK